MASPEPPVALKDQCSIIHNNTLYVYSPDALQTLPLRENATWTQEENGVSVTGAICVKGGIDGDGANPALYVVGGATNGTASGYSGLQRYSLLNKVWETITPISAVTANRINHGATYLNASSAILVYGGSQTGDAGYSTETFLMLMYPPYRVQAYSSIAPAVRQPFLLPWSDDKALMVGGGNGNQRTFTFHPDPGWVDLGVSLPVVLPDPATAQVNLQWLADGTRVLQTYYTNESPNRVTRNVLTNPGFVPAPYGQTIGDPTGTSSRLFRRQLIQANYPTYNSTNEPVEQRTGASLASNSDVVAIIGGDSNSTVSVFNATGNSWIDSKALFGDTQQPLTTSSTTSATPTPTSSQTRTATSAASSTAAAAKSDGNQTNSLAILGGVLGGICGLAAILIIALLWLRSIKRRKAGEVAARQKQNDAPYANDKPRNFPADNDGSLQPLSQQAQPMGRSPVASTVISEPDSVAIFGGKTHEKSVEAGEQSRGGSRLNPNHNANNSIGGFFKSNNKTPLSISKPMLPDLGNYQERPNIDLGKATPSAAPVLPAAAGVASPQQKMDQRKTDEGWAKYFQADKNENKKVSETDPNSSLDDDPRRSGSRPSTAKGGSGGFWPGSGVSSSNRSTKLPLRDSAGNTLNHFAVTTASPSLAVGHSDPQARSLSVATPVQAKISSADSISTDNSSDDGYEDDDIDAYSDGRDSYQHNAWNPIGNTWSGPSQRPLRPPSVRVGATAFPPPTSHSEETTNTSGSGESSIPSFPMPAGGTRRSDPIDQYIGTSTVQAPPRDPYAPPSSFAHARKSSNTFHNGGAPVHDYFGPPGTATTQGSGKLTDSTDMSWLNLGTPAHVHGSPHSGESHDPA